MPEIEYIEKNLVSTLVGTMPMLITCPHGAKRDPAGCPDGFPPRDPCKSPPNCDFEQERDKYTIEITKGVVEKINELTNNLPYVVLFGVHRSCIDANRPLGCAYDVPQAAKYYREYHRSIRNFIKKMFVENGNKKGLLLDFHGFGKKKARNGNECHIAIGTDNGTSIYPYSHDVLFEQFGLIHLLKKRGYEVSPGIRGECEIDELNGGYTTENYSSLDHKYQALCIQVEMANSKRDPESERKKLQNDLAKSIVTFCDHYCN